MAEITVEVTVGGVRVTAHVADVFQVAALIATVRAQIEQADKIQREAAAISASASPVPAEQARLPEQSVDTVQVTEIVADGNRLRARGPRFPKWGVAIYSDSCKFSAAAEAAVQAARRTGRAECSLQGKLHSTGTKLAELL